MEKPQYGLIPVIFGFVTLIIIIIGIFGLIVNFETLYDPTVTNYSSTSDGLLINGTTREQVTATSGLIATITPNMVWIFILFAVLAVLYGVYHITKRRRGTLITRRRRL